MNGSVVVAAGIVCITGVGLRGQAGLISHSNEQYGDMAVYLRLKGIVPPSTESQAGLLAMMTID